MRQLVLVLIVACAGVSTACRAQGDTPGVTVLPGMAFSIPYDAYDRNPITGQTLQKPPEGTVPYGARVFDYAPGREEAARAGAEVTNPLAATAQAELPRGKRVYDTYCLVCHGPAGEGDGPIIGRFPNPPSLLAPRAKAMPDGELYHIVYHGQGLMPPYAYQIPDDDRWRAVTYVRWLQGVEIAGAGGAK